MVQISTNPRKRRRFLENEAYAKDARFWIGKIKSADRIGNDKPVDRQAVIATASKNPPNIKAQVYLAKFTSPRIGEPPFLKVGMSRNPSNRFKLDAGGYGIEIVLRSRSLRWADANALEQSILELMKRDQYRPIRLLSSGNTECVIYTPEILTKISELFAGLA